MSDFDRFVAFLKRAADGYHRPPEVPSEAMWERVQTALDAGAAEGPRPEVNADLGDDALGLAAAAYHAPPVTPHEDMWERIAPAWELRRSAPASVREAGLDDLEPPAIGHGGERSAGGRSRRLYGAMAIAIAASMVIGIGIGRVSLGSFASGGAQVASTGDEAAPTGTAARTAAVGADRAPGGVPDAVSTAPPGGEAPLAAGDLEPGQIETLESGARLAADPTAGRPTSADPTGEAVASGPADVSAGDAGAADRDASRRRDAAFRYATVRHLGRAETLLTAFQSQEEVEREAVSIYGWARELLGDTRLLLDAPADRSPQERRLLQELELVLAQIAGLGPDVADFERGLVRDGIERGGTLPRLRAAAPPGATRTMTGT